MTVTKKTPTLLPMKSVTVQARKMHSRRLEHRLLHLRRDLRGEDGHQSVVVVGRQRPLEPGQQAIQVEDEGLHEGVVGLVVGEEVVADVVAHEGIHPRLDAGLDRRLSQLLEALENKEKTFFAV